MLYWAIHSIGMGGVFLVLFTGKLMHTFPDHTSIDHLLLQTYALPFRQVLFSELYHRYHKDVHLYPSHHS